MRLHLSPFRLAVEMVLNLFGRGPRRSRFTPARNPETRVRFAQYLSRVQPEPDPAEARRAARLLGSGGALSRGLVRHARLTAEPAGGPPRRTTMHLFAQPGELARRRRAQAGAPSSLRTLLNALRAR